MKVLVSVYKKTGIVDFCKQLIELGHELISTGGTAALLKENALPFTAIEKITGNPESFDGRMKTISFQVGSALLYRRGHEKDEIEAKNLKINPIDMVVCNLYPFVETAKKNPSTPELIEMIDIGGPTMIRAGSKNYASVTVVVDPSDYSKVIDEIKKGGTTSLETREKLALKAFQMTSSYDLSIQLELARRFEKESTLPQFSLEEKSLRYGENPHQKAKLSVIRNTTAETTLASAPVLQGKEISYNNYLDSDPAFKCASELKNLFPNLATAVIVKHGTPCGIATAKTLAQALAEAWECDSISAFGGIIALTEKVTAEVAEFFQKRFVEVILAPDYTKEALELFAQKKNVRLIQVPLKTPGTSEITFRSINGGFLIQQEDEKTLSYNDIDIKSEFDFSALDEKLIPFGQTVIKYLKSNCLALVEKNSAEVFRILASGVGQPNRLECLTKLISSKISGKDLSKALLVSDAFFPFRDSIDSAHELGIRYILQPGGSIKDEEVIAAAKEHKIGMAFTKTRHFRH